MIILLPKVLNDSTIFNFIASFKMDSMEKVDLITIDFSELTAINPMGMTALAAYLIYIKHLKLCDNFKIVSPRDPAIISHLNRMKFFALLGLDSDDDLITHNGTGAYKEIFQLNSTKDCSNAAKDVFDILSVHLNITPDLKEALDYAISEVTDNIFHHSSSPINGFISAWNTKCEKTVEIAIVDCGQGFKNSLLRNMEYAEKIKSMDDALNYAIKKKVTGNPGYNAGEGLFFTKELVLQNNGRLHIYSENACLLVENQEIKTLQVPYWHGAIINLTFNIEKRVDLTGLFNKYSPDDDEIEFLNIED